LSVCVHIMVCVCVCVCVCVFVLACVLVYVRAQALESHIKLPGEFVFRSGEKAGELYFIKAGASSQVTAWPSTWQALKVCVCVCVCMRGAFAGGLDIMLSDGRTVVGRGNKGEIFGQVGARARPLRGSPSA
jgi:hypothetical protein